MAWTAPQTAVAGQVLTASYLNTNLRDNLDAIATWTTYTPSWTNVTIGNGTNAGAYIQAGKTVAYWIKFNLGTTSAVSGTPVVTLPVAGKSSGIGSHSGLFEDTGVGYIPIVARMSGSSIECYAPLASGTYVSAASLSATIPFTWGNTDIIWLGGIYEAA